MRHLLTAQLLLLRLLLVLPRRVVRDFYAR